MFSPTIPLLRRAENRLRGYRTPAIRILRKLVAGLDYDARTAGFVGPRLPMKTKGPGRRLPVRPLTFRDLLQYNSSHVEPADMVIQSSLKRPPTIQAWTHGVYSFQSHILAGLPVAAIHVKFGLRSYCNILPRNMPPIIPDVVRSNVAYRTLFRTFISDRNRHHAIKPDLVGKLKRPRRTGFWLLFRNWLKWEPAVVFKHFSCGRIVAVAFTYDMRQYILKGYDTILRHHILQSS